MATNLLTVPIRSIVQLKVRISIAGVQIVPEKLANEIEEINYNFGGVGLIVFDGEKLVLRKKSSKKVIGIGEKTELLEGIAKAACRDASKYYLAR